MAMHAELNGDGYPQQTLEFFIVKHGVKMTAERTDSNPNMDDSRNMDHWKVTLRCGRRRMSLVFSMGFGHNGKQPKVADVLDCLSSDASSVEGNDFDSWASDLGFDADSRKAKRTYDTCVRQMRALGRFLGPDAYAELLWNTERL